MVSDEGWAVGDAVGKFKGKILDKHYNTPAKLPNFNFKKWGMIIVENVKIE